jgi:hypothetical protein
LVPQHFSHFSAFVILIISVFWVFLLKMPFQTTKARILSACFQSFTPKDEQKRQQIVRELEIIYLEIERNRWGYCYDTHDLELYNIVLRGLSLDKTPTENEDTFFIPMAKEDLDKYPPDLAHEDTKTAVERLHRIWDEGDYPDWAKGRHPANRLNDRQTDAERLCKFMRKQFVEMERNVPNSTDRTTLPTVSGWIRT